MVRIGDIAFLAAVGFLVGVAIADLSFGVLIPALLGVPVLVVWLRHLGCRSISRGARIILGIIAAVSAGIFYAHFSAVIRTAGEHYPSARSAFRVLAVSEPRAAGNYLSFSGELQPPFSGEISVFVPGGSMLHYGDLVAMTSTLSAPLRPDDPPAVFPKSFAISARGGGSSVMRAAVALRTAGAARFNEWLPNDAAGLLAGMLFGGAADLDPSLRQEMSASETLYVVSLYGYKMGMIMVCLDFFLGDWVPRIARSVLAAVIGMAMVLLSGGSIAALRAGLAAAMLLAARHAGTAYVPRNGFAFAAAALAFADPAAVTGPGFSLTFLSVAGMVSLPTPIRNFLHLGGGRGFFEWKEAVTVSLASLLPIIPSIAARSGFFSLAAVPANILMAPAILPGIVLGALLAIVPAALPAVTFLVVRAADAFIQYPLFVIRFFAAHAVPLPFSFSSASSWLLYFSALMLFFFVYRDRPSPTTGRDANPPS